MVTTPIIRSTDGDWNLPHTNITFEWISGAWNKAADCLSSLVELSNDSNATVKMLTVTHSDGPPFNTRSKTSHQTATYTEHSTTPPDIDTITQDFTPTQRTQDIMLRPLINVKLRMQKMDPFCKCISKWLSSGKAPKHEADLFTHVKGLVYKHVRDANQKFMALIVPKAWKYTILVEAHDKLGPPGVTHTYCFKNYNIIGRNEQGHPEIYS